MLEYEYYDAAVDVEHWYYRGYRDFCCGTDKRQDVLQREGSNAEEAYIKGWETAERVDHAYQNG